ncbi:carbamate kinase [Draconibacterium mangrovi]|uniref:carbamate kinase n=1 Tax=Draconibacterium mangrovi TaxID=2697469 RepID=UPI0013D3435A|nr:carbamate kinase [Draconibacterium mangrovi]
MKKRAVVALGGNAILRGNEEGTIVQQEKNVTDTLENLVPLLRDGYELVLTHGNGPQVGNILMRNAAGEQLYGIAPMPLNICVADSQGGIGFMIERMMRNVLNKYGIEKNVISMVTLVEIDANDPAFQNPSKRIGKVYSKTEADKLAQQKGWEFKFTSKSKDGYRRVVPSPMPIDILNKDIIRQLLENGNIVIAAGGGGIPVYFDENNDVRTLDAVIDKDRASGMLATNIDADELYILTDVPFIYKDFGEETQQKLEFLNYSDTLKHLENGTFAEGTMEPKIKACLDFIKNGGSKSIITEATKLADKSYGSKITMEYKDEEKIDRD